jgi:hypothetical protein
VVKKLRMQVSLLIVASDFKSCDITSNSYRSASLVT